MIDANHRILLIDDDASNRITLAALLEDEGYVVDAAASGQEGQAGIQGPRCYGAVLLDWELDDRSGAGLAVPLAAHQPQARVIVVTGERAQVPPAPSFHGVYQRTDRFEVLLDLLGGEMALVR